MPKRKTASNPSSSSTPPAPVAKEGTTYSLLDGGVDILQGLVMHREVISEEFESELISFVQTQCARGRRGELKKQQYIRASGKRSQGKL